MNQSKQKLSDNKIRKAISVIKKWQQQLETEKIWDWDLLGQAAQSANEAIDHYPKYDRAWTTLAYVYQRIGRIELAKRCLKRAYSLVPLTSGFPGRFYNKVENCIENDFPFNKDGSIKREPPPVWFIEKYKKFLTF